MRNGSRTQVVNAPPRVLTAQEAAAYLRVSTVLVRRLAQAGELPGMKVGRVWRFRSELIRAWALSATAPQVGS
jgi:excisionase family DNA binding protein